MPWLAIQVALVTVCFAGTAEAQRCLHGPDESEVQSVRRQAAIAFVQQLNDVQTRLERERGSYVALAEAVSAADVPIGFVPRLIFDRWGYTITLKDTLDACGYSLFSDQHGTIYEGRPVARVVGQPRPQVVPPSSDADR